MANVNKSPLRRLLAFDEIGILASLALFFIIGALSSPYFLTVSNPLGQWIVREDQRYELEPA